MSDVSHDQGARLSKLLAGEAPGWDEKALDALIEGVLAAPEPEDSAAWMTLVCEAPSPELTAALAARKEARAAARSKPAKDYAARLAALRGELKRQGVEGFVVPRADEHQGEYVPANAERLSWITGFTGSAGLALILPERAAAFSDGRYTIQIKQQVPGDLFDVRHITDEPPSDWLAETLKEGERLGFDPKLHSPAQKAQLERWVTAAGGVLVALESNPLDAVWEGRPAAPLSPAQPHSLDYAGESSESKRQRLAAGLKKQKLVAAVITLPESIAWLLNLRGGDVPHTPFTLSYALLKADASVEWFVDSRKVTPALKRALGNEVSVQPPASLASALAALGKGGAKVLADPATAGTWVFDRLAEGGAAIERAADPCLLPKAAKNEVEIEGAREAHRRDAPAVVRLLAWLEREALSRHAAGDPVTEMEVVERLLAYRRELPLFRDLSFDTISSTGPNGALNHYRVTEESNLPLSPGELFLLDSGGQFPDGTTDITRTVPVGEPSQEMKERYTLVLKGHLALSDFRFPKGTTGSQIDVLARLPLWQAGLDFDHGTGHGVGSYLSVHEGPQRISKVPNAVALQPGMILSNEPGYYKAGAYGIRIENLVTVVEAAPLSGQEREMLTFETLTLCPYEPRLILTELLTESERAWIDAYHTRVWDALSPRLSGADLEWLREKTRPLS
jgi:Xaa-Pro aminopeptidase